MKQGEQIAYIPRHAKIGGLKHPDVEFGFVFSISPADSELIFCRYWFRDKPGTLRTTTCSEGTNVNDLRRYDSVNQGLVEETIKYIKREILND